MLKILYIDGVGPFGGASRSLFEVVRVLSGSDVQAYFVAARGTALGFYNKIATKIVVTRGLTSFDNTRYSHYRGLRWVVLIRELFHFPYSLVAVFRAYKRFDKIDLIHVNEITEIIPGILAKIIFKAPMLVHVRSLQRVSKHSWRCQMMDYLLKKYADGIVAIDENTRATLNESLQVDIIHNSFTSVDEKNDPAFDRRLLELTTTDVKVGFVGNLQHSKGLFDLLEAARILHNKGRSVQFVIVGGATKNSNSTINWLLGKLGLAQDIEHQLEDRIQAYGLQNCFHLLGPTTNIYNIYQYIDLICFPSHFDAPGRPVFEAAFSGVPSIVAVDQPHPDTLITGETGIAIPMMDPEKLAEAIIYFDDHREELSRMGKNARELAELNFVPSINAELLGNMYRRICRQ